MPASDPTLNGSSACPVLAAARRVLTAVGDAAHRAARAATPLSDDGLEAAAWRAIAAELAGQNERLRRLVEAWAREEEA